MRVFQSAVLRSIPGIAHGTAPLGAQPLTFSGNRRQDVNRARQRFLKTVDVPLLNLTLGRQVHGSRVRIVGASERGAGSTNPATYLASTDGCLTQQPDIALGIFTADCVPILLTDPVSGWIGALHAGWRGAVKGIVPKALRLLKANGVDLRTVRVWLGPSICAKHYLVDGPCGKKLAKVFFGNAVSKRADGYAVDLRKGLAVQLVRGGIRRTHIETNSTCTFEDRRLPSARRDGPTHANTLSVIVRHAETGDMRGKQVAVYGLGVQGGGEAAVHYAVQQGGQVVAIDAKPAAAFSDVRRRLRGLPVRFAFGPKSSTALRDADVIIKNPGVPRSALVLRQAKARGALVTSDIGLFRQRSANPLVAITGTKGKTTVATWLAAMLRTRQPQTILAGNVRHSPLLERRAYDGRTPVVLELSSFQLEALDQPLRPKLAVITNLYPDHLDRHRSMRAYAAVKAKVFEGQGAADSIIAPLDSEWRRYATLRTKAKTYWTSDQPDPLAHAFLKNDWIMLRLRGRSKRLLAIHHLHQQDIGTVRSAVTVALAGRLLGFSTTVIRRVLTKFRGVPDRFETVRTHRGRTFINNTTATNPAAAAAGIRSVHGRCIAIAGGTDKGLPLGALVQALNRTAAVVLLPGTATKAIAPKLHVPVRHARSMAVAVHAAVALSEHGDTILLSPGAASFGLFRNEFDRGAKFVSAVQALR